MAKADSKKPSKKGKSKDEKKKSDKKKNKGGDTGCFGGGGDKKKKDKKDKGKDKDKEKKKDKKGKKDKSAPKETESVAAKSAESKTQPKDASPGGSQKSKSPSHKSPARSPSVTAAGPMDMTQADDAASRKLRFDDTVRVKEIPDRKSEHEASLGVKSSTKSSYSRRFPPEGSELDLRTEVKYGDPYFGSKVPMVLRTPCPQQSEKKDPDLYSTRSMTLDEPGPLFDPNRCPTYGREELISIMETLVLGINDRESLKTRYDEGNTRLAMNAEFYHDKVEAARAKLECMRNQQTQLDAKLKESVDMMSRNFMQLTRERKRIAGAIDLREDFDRHLQKQITTNTKFVQDYAQILGKLEGLVDDSSMAWLQRETMISTESEALERLHMSVEKERNMLQGELHRYEALYVAQTQQNAKLGRVVEQELERYATKQQEIIRYNEKRIRALEGCVRTMQLDREVMYGEIGEARGRLREVLETRVINMMDRVRVYKKVLKGLEREISTLIYRCGTDSVVPATQALQAYIRLCSNIGLIDFATRVTETKAYCDDAETYWRTKSCQKRDLNDVRRSHVDHLRKQMLISEDEYFLMEPVDVPGSESNTNFQRSSECFVPEAPANACSMGGGPSRAMNVDAARSAPAPNDAPSDAASYMSSKATGDAPANPLAEKPAEDAESVKPEARKVSLKDAGDNRSFRKRTFQGILAMPKKTFNVMNTGVKKLSHVVGNIAHHH